MSRKDANHTRMTVYIKKTVVKKLKHAILDLDKSMSAVVEELIEKWLEEQEQEQGE